MSINKAFDFISKFENIPLWNYYVINVWKDKDAEGKIYHQIRKTDHQTFKIVEESKPNKIKIETINQGGIQFSRIFQIRENNENGCILDDHFEINLGKPQFVQRNFQPQIKKAVKENLLKLKELCNKEVQFFRMEGNLIYKSVIILTF